jgi:hypothetical protein
VFNPAIVSFRGERLMAHRVVTPDMRRRIAVCRLDEAWNVRPESLVPLSDHLVGGGDWHADPRFCVHGERLFLHFNDGARVPNQISVVELDPDRLLPTGPARPLVLDGRRAVEKNWLLFDYDDAVFAVYWSSPHVVLRVRLDGHGPVRCEPAFEVRWDASPYAARHGEPRGGTPPVRAGNRYFSFFHSFRLAPFALRLVRRALGRHERARRYLGGFYGFDAAPPFAPARIARAPVLEPPRLKLPHRRRLDPGSDCWVYPSGAVLLDGQWVVSYGSRDQFCCLQVLSHEALLAMTVPVTPS